MSSNLKEVSQIQYALKQQHHFTPTPPVGAVLVFACSETRQLIWRWEERRYLLELAGSGLGPFDPQAEATFPPSMLTRCRRYPKTYRHPDV